MITAVEIRKKTERKYVDYLRSVVAGSEFEPIVIPCDKKASASMDEYQRELTDIRSQSKEVKGFGYTIEWKTVKTKALGEQDLPERVLFESASDIERFLQKCGEVSQFRKDVAMLLDEFPQLRSWVERYPLKVVRLDVDPQHNPFGLALDCYDGAPQRIEAPSPAVPPSGRPGGGLSQGGNP